MSTIVLARACRLLLLSVVAGAALSSPCRAHFPWLATDDEGHALLYFGESPQDRAYRLPDAVAGAKVVVRQESGEPATLELAAEESDDFIGRKSAEPIAAGDVLEAEIRYGVYHGMLLDYYARHFPALGASTPASGLKLDAA